jgi:hypothetical protein
MKISLIGKTMSRYQQNANISPNLKHCPRCQSKNVVYKQHDCRTRNLRYLENFLVKTFQLILFRWKCTVCEKSFTVYPAFLLPYKRFITPSICQLCQQYLRMGEATYRQIVHPEERHYAYVDDDNKELSHVSLWNWFNSLSIFAEYARKGVQLLLRTVPESSIHRDIIPINSRKYKSDDRKHCLEQTELVLRVVRHFHEHNIDVKIFPTILNTC